MGIIGGWTPAHSASVRFLEWRARKGNARFMGNVRRVRNSFKKLEAVAHLVYQQQVYVTTMVNSTLMAKSGNQTIVARVPVEMAKHSVRKSTVR